MPLEVSANALLQDINLSVSQHASELRKSLPYGSANGFSLIELMIAMVIMLVVTMVTVKIEANVFRTNTESIRMIQLSQEMRSTIQLVARDIRRSGYNDDSLANFLSTQPINSGVTMGTSMPTM